MIFNFNKVKDKQGKTKSVLKFSTLIILFVFLKISFAATSAKEESEVRKEKSELKNTCLSSNSPLCKQCVNNMLIPLFHKDYDRYLELLNKSRYRKLTRKIPESRKKQYSDIKYLLDQAIIKKRKSFLNSLNNTTTSLLTCIATEDEKACGNCEQSLKQQKDNWKQVTHEIDACIYNIEAYLVDGTKEQLQCELIQVKPPIQPTPVGKQSKNQTGSEDPKENLEIKPFKASKQVSCTKDSYIKLPHILKQKLNQDFLYIPAGRYATALEHISLNKKLYLKELMRKMQVDDLSIDVDFAIQLNEVAIFDFMKIGALKGKSYTDFIDKNYCRKYSVDSDKMPASCLLPKSIFYYFGKLNEKSIDYKFSLPTLKQWLVIAILYGEENPVFNKDTPVEITNTGKLKNLFGNVTELSSEIDSQGNHYLFGGSYVNEKGDTGYGYNLNQLQISVLDKNESRNNIGFRGVVTSTKSFSCFASDHIGEK